MPNSRPHIAARILPANATPSERLAYLALARRVTALDGGVALVVAAQIGLHILAAWLHAGWWTAAALDGTMLALLGSLALLLSDARPLLGRLAFFGLVAGCGELFTDFSGEYLIPSLHYPTDEPMIWASPAYMPISWLLVLTGLGYLAWRLAALVGRRWALWICAIVGAANVPFYEEMAYRAGWWHYNPVRPLWHTPAYVLLFEGLIGASLPFLLRHIEQRPWRAIAWRGVLLSAWMPVAALLAWVALGH